MLELRDLVKHYHTAGEETVRAVDGVSMSVAAGEMVALYGPSGSGKTTLLLLIATMLRPDSGRISYRGRELSGLSEKETSRYLRRELGLVHQSFSLMPRVSAVENASVKLLLDGVAPRKARERAQPWLERLGLGEREAHTPEQLSGGERQRLAIARALVSEPALVLADEPTANLDSRRSMETVGLLAQIAHEHGTGVLLVTHDTGAATLADRSCTMRDGRLVEEPAGEADGRRALAGAADARGEPER